VTLVLTHLHVQVAKSSVPEFWHVIPPHAAAIGVVVGTAVVVVVVVVGVVVVVVGTVVVAPAAHAALQSFGHISFIES